MINRNRLVHTATNQCLTGSLHALAYYRTMELANNHNQLCERHTDAVRKAISDVGLGEFLCTSIEEAIRKNTAAYQSNRLTRDIYDPENLSLASLVGYAMWKRGRLDHGACPLCALGDIATKAISHVAGHQRLIAETNGFLARN